MPVALSLTSISERLDEVSLFLTSIRERLDEVSLFLTSIRERLDEVSLFLTSIRQRLDAVSLFPTSIRQRLDEVSLFLTSIRQRLDEVSLFPTPIRERLDEVSLFLTPFDGNLRPLRNYLIPFSFLLTLVRSSPSRLLRGAKGVRFLMRRVSGEATRCISFQTQAVVETNRVRTCSKPSESFTTAVRPGSKGFRVRMSPVRPRMSPVRNCMNDGVFFTAPASWTTAAPVRSSRVRNQDMGRVSLPLKRFMFRARRAVRPSAQPS